MGKNSLDNLALQVAKISDPGTLDNLGRNIEAAASSTHLFSEYETKAIRAIVDKINIAPGIAKQYTFDPASMQVN